MWLPNAENRPDALPAGLADALDLSPLANSFGLEGGAEWVVIPYGDHPHQAGRVIQRMNRPAAERLVQMFNSWRGQITRQFGGLPFYVGHPDHPDFRDRHTDTRAYGWVDAIEARDDGLAQHVKWSAPGRELLANAHYKWFSPNWFARKVGRENGADIVEPVWIKSNGLTNNPVIAGAPLANENTHTEDTTMLEFLRTLLGLANEAGEDVIKTALGERLAQQTEVSTQLANEQTARTTAEGQVLALTTERDTATTELANAQTAHAEAFKAERGERIVLLVNEAISAGRITPAQKDTWIADLTADFDGKSVELANAKPAMKTHGRTDHLGARNTQERAKVDQILNLVNEEMTKTHCNHHTAHMRVKKSHPDLFAEKSGDESHD